MQKPAPDELLRISRMACQQAQTAVASASSARCFHDRRGLPALLLTPRHGERGQDMRPPVTAMSTPAELPDIVRRSIRFISTAYAVVGTSSN